MKANNVRAIYRAATVSGYSAPYDTLHMKVYYPAAYGDSAEERNSGFIPVDESRGPLPVIILMAGTNVGGDGLRWLAHKLAENGYAVVTYDWVTLDFGDTISNSPGVNIKRLTHKHYGKKPSCPALEPILAELKRLQKKSILAGQLNLKRIILGGHSAGGSMALFNANPDWFPQVRGAFCYGAHSAANVQLGWDKDSIMPLSRDMPMLIMGGEKDGVIAASSHRYGDAADSNPYQRIERTFHEGLKGKRGDRYLVIIKGANHFSFVRQVDSATGRPFLDQPVEGSNKQIRKYMSQLIINFCNSVSSGDAMAAAELQGLCNTSQALAIIAEYK